MLRDNLKDKQYFEQIIESFENSHKRRLIKFEQGLVKEDRVRPVKNSMIQNQINLMSAMYSFGASIEKVMSNYAILTDLISRFWPGEWKLYHKDNYLHQYTLSAYYDIFLVLSLGFLTGASNSEFKKIVSAIDKDQVRDLMIEFIVSAKLSDRKFTTEESYTEKFWIPEIYKTLREAVLEEDSTKAESLIKRFVKKEWYKNYKDAGWHNTHKSAHDAYVGYWCFEAAAVTCIKGLDDRSYRDHPYYPKDLADYYRENVK